MARRSFRSLAALLISLALGGCSAPDGENTTAPAPATSSISSTTPTSVATTTTTNGPGRDVDATVTVPDGDGPFPAVVLVHGGGWVTGNPGIMDRLADHLNDNGFLIVNTRYTLATSRNAGFPAAVDDVACAVRLAADHPDGDGTVTVVGHSAGAHIGAIVALTGNRYGTDCLFPGIGLPERFVGLAGLYDISRLAPAMTTFFGGGPDLLAAEWEAGNPQILTDENPGLDSLIMYGERDGLVPSTFAIDFHEALILSGSESILEPVEDARHNDMHDPDLVGDLIVTWLER
jgi:acetyl esterase/lipase